MALLPALLLSVASGHGPAGRARHLPVARQSPRRVGRGRAAGPARPIWTALFHAADPTWVDTAIDRDSREAAARLRSIARPSDSLFVWGFRPELYVYTGLPAATRFLDSQPLTGVPADRHLTDSTPVEAVAPRERRRELARSSPSFIVDGLGLYNPRLAIADYPDL